ncbi:MAG: inosine-5-monophosphate dehydrogenase [Flavobacteriales bacterium]|nr:inosine-5-monophosphate dehydrogenase [Flavobacteriales bacterium]|tara:strand:+ start:621 stop:1094 length:474 start_codon:yes stop_codon:yes gene_type:complete
MVMSYRGARAEADPKERLQNIQIREHMTPLSKLITFKADQKVQDVMSTLINKKISGGPVVDEDGKLVGLISEGDCLKEVVRGKYYNTPKDSGSVADHMAINVITIDPEKDIFEVARMFLELKFRRFPVIENGKLIGQVSQSNIMQAVLGLKEEDWRR